MRLSAREREREGKEKETWMGEGSIEEKGNMKEKKRVE